MKMILTASLLLVCIAGCADSAPTPPGTTSDHFKEMQYVDLSPPNKDTPAAAQEEEPTDSEEAKE